MKQCNKCNLPETYETIEFNKTGSCNICENTTFKKKKINWELRKKKLDQLIQKYRGKYSYDCIVPFSGGKDSTYTLYYLMKEYNIKPLVVTFDHGFMRKNVLENSTRTFKKLGVDVIKFTPNWKIVKKLMEESFRRKSDFCWHCHTGIQSYPLRVAVQQKIPLVFWGEPQSEITDYFSYKDDEIEYQDETKFDLITNLGITANDMHNMIKDKTSSIELRDLYPYTFPAKEELEAINYCSVPLGSFVPWDYQKNTELIKKKLGWKVDQIEGIPENINPNGEKTECFMQASRDYIKYLKRGYSRATQITAFQVRNNKMSTEEASKIIKQFDGLKPKSLDILLEYLQMDETEFNNIISKMVIPPNKPNFETNKIASEAKDFDEWYRENKN
ncbi:N-acetyl sugar amidotransferase [Candidatus Pelagibacter bacterium]|nr:N-acetyl sugar amidotransferase [Candidatus Pelagibacter bacterium]